MLRFLSVTHISVISGLNLEAFSYNLENKFEAVSD